MEEHELPVFPDERGERRAVGGGGLHVRQRVETVERPAYGVERLIAGVVLEPAQYAAVGAFGVVERENRAAERHRDVRRGGDRNAVARQGKRVARDAVARVRFGRDLRAGGVRDGDRTVHFLHAVARESGGGREAALDCRHIRERKTRLGDLRVRERDAVDIYRLTRERRDLYGGAAEVARALRTARYRRPARDACRSRDRCPAFR